MSYTKQFEQFWKLYPGRTNKSGRIKKQDKLGAFAEWCKMARAERLLAMFNHPEQGTYTPDARKWLFHKRWEDEDVTDSTKAKTKHREIEKQRNSRPDDRKWIMEQTSDKLKEFIKQWPHYEWRIKELRPEIFDAKGGD